MRADEVLADVSKMSDEDFAFVVKATSLARIYKDRIIFTDYNARRRLCQKPFEIGKYTMRLDEDGYPDWKDAREKALVDPKPTALIQRDVSGNLEMLFYLPPALNEKEPHLKDLTYEFAILEEIRATKAKP